MLFGGAAGVVLAGCATNPETGATELFGLIPADAALDAAEAAAGEAAGSGGLLGILGVVAGTAIGIWRRRREQTLRAAAESVIEGVDEILAKARAAQTDGGSWTPTPEELTALLKAAQNAAGTRATVDEIRQTQ